MKSAADRTHIAAGTPIAIIGMGCFFPKSSNLQEYWRLLVKGLDAISVVPDTHWSVNDYFDPDPKKADHVYCKRGGFLSPVQFDPLEFGIPPAALEATDTSQLLALLAAKQALADAGYGDERRAFNRERTSVILGVTGTQELVIPLSTRLSHPIWRRALTAAGISPAKINAIIQSIAEAYVPWQENSFPGLLGNVVAGRICNRLDLGGTNCVVDAACASSMSAVHLAMMELKVGRSDMVITGGVDTLNDIFMHMCFAKTRVLSPTGDARPFSKFADGTVLGEGVGLLVLKRLPDAEKDGDRIYAVIRGLGSSSDGKSQSIYAPRAEGQVGALRGAYSAAGVEPGTVELIEAHGTGTKVGDRVEFEALKQVFGADAVSGRHCALGSVKSMIGHTKAAAGAAGIIKAALALYHKILPPTLKAEEPDPDLNLPESPFYLNTASRPWLSRDAHPRRAGVSAFGFGGSNFHAVLEEYRPLKQEPAWDGSVEILAASAATRPQLLKRLELLQEAAEEGTAEHVRLAAAAAQSRKQFSASDPYRFLTVFDRSRETAEALAERIARIGETLSGDTNLDAAPAEIISGGFYGGPGGQDSLPGKIAFVFPGQGSQYVGMGRDLVCCFPEAHAAIEIAERKFSGPGRLSDILYPPEGLTPQFYGRQEELLQFTEIAQPAIGALSLALVDIVRRFGLEPDAACGHSFGELTALYAAGWIEPETLMDLAAARGRFMAAAVSSESGSRQPAGAMLAVGAPLVEIEKLAAEEPSLVLANRNSPAQGVLSGPAEAIAAAERRCRELGFKTRRLPVGAAFHSPLLRRAQAPFRKFLEAAAIVPSGIPVYANTTAVPYATDAEKARETIAGQILQPVDFVSEIENMYADGIRTFLEIGPKAVLSGLIRSILKDRSVRVLALDASAGKRSAMADLAAALCRLAAAGYPLALERWEKPVAAPKRARMPVAVLGANFQPQPKQSKAGLSGLPAPSDDRNAHYQDSPGTVTPMREKNETAGKENGNDAAFLGNALRMLQEGLRSMQALQAQTAAAHQKFLETQAEAGRVLREMMESTQQLGQAALGYPRATGPSTGPAQDEVTGFAKKAPGTALQPGAENGSAPIYRKENGFSSPPENDLLSLVPNRSEEPPVDPVAAAPPAVLEGKGTAATGTKRSRPGTEIEAALLSVVSELTGYPPEMLGLEMDIEADLGIDSIKRVEILSTLEERLPGLPAVAPELMGRLKTLAQIVAHFSGQEGEKAISVPVGSDIAIAEDAREQESPAASKADQAAIEAALLAVVSELTGYPPEMLGLEMDIEADLGIDSIKRVEILSTLEERLPGLPAVAPELMGRLKTLAQIIAHFAGAAADREAVLQIEPTTIKAEMPQQNMPESLQSGGDASSDLSRRVVAAVPSPLKERKKMMPPAGSRIYITGDDSGLSEAIARALTQRGFETVRLAPGESSVNASGAKASGLIIVTSPETDLQAQEISAHYFLAQLLAPELMASAASGGAFLATLTRLDGAFGFKGKGVRTPLQGSLAGLVKTAALEWEAVRCRALDIDPAWRQNDRIAAAVAAEILSAAASDPLEIGLCADGRSILELRSEPILPAAGHTVALGPDDVVVVSGGARGITAAAATALAERYRPILVLLGRSPLPAAEPDWLAAETDPALIRKAIMHHEFAGRRPSPVQVEKRFQQYMAGREIAATLSRLKAVGATVHYHSVDIRRSEAVLQVFEKIHSEYGPVTAVFHGAGVLEDRLIADKTRRQFARVFDTKVKGLQNMLAAVAGEPLKYLVLFSSVAARLGNRGQSDYAMANEALNKIAQQQAVLRPDCRVVSVNWGPWDGGMVSTALKKEFSRNRIPLIAPEAGARHLLAELARKSGAPVEVLIGADLIGRQPAPAVSGEATLSLAMKREVDVETLPILSSHILDGIPVVPFALIAEWFGHGALHENPGLSLLGLDDMRLLKGIRLDRQKRLIRLFAGKARKDRSVYAVDVELRDGVQNDADVIHSRAKAILTESFDPPPAYQIPVELSAGNYARSRDEVYEKILFHGSALRGIREIVSCTPRGMLARLTTAPPPDQWMKEPFRSRWIADPLVLDSAFQMATVWCFEEKGFVSLPSYYARYRQYRKSFPEKDVTAVLKIVEAGVHKMKGDFTFLDGDGVVIAQIHGYEAVMDGSLFKAFKRQPAARA